MDDADFADDGGNGVGGFDFDLGEIAAFGDFLAGFIGAVPEKLIEAGFAPSCPAKKSHRRTRKPSKSYSVTRTGTSCAKV